MCGEMIALSIPGEDIRAEKVVPAVKLFEIHGGINFQ